MKLFKADRSHTSLRWGSGLREFTSKLPQINTLGTYRPQGRLLGSLIYRVLSVGRFGSPSVPFGCLWELLGVTLGRLGVPWEPSWGDGGGSFGVALGCLWNVLGCLGVRLGAPAGVAETLCLSTEDGHPGTRKTVKTINLMVPK